MRPTLEIFSENLSLDSFVDFVNENKGEVIKTIYNEVYVSFYFDKPQNKNKSLGSIHCGNIVESIKKEGKLYFELDIQPKSSYIMSEILYKLNLRFSIKAQCSIGVLMNLNSYEFIYNKFTYKDSYINLFDIYHNYNESFMNSISSILTDMGLKYDISKNPPNIIDLKTYLYSEECLIKNDSIKIAIYDDVFTVHSLSLFLKNISIGKDICICISGLFTLHDDDFNRILKQKTVLFF
ncbi:hypothetical protein [Runella sp.]|uniref:hypothetical protein n=1 Tax=Runella sp. TaxID=1960881 RepID=UPI003D0C7E38